MRLSIARPGGLPPLSTWNSIDSVPFGPVIPSVAIVIALAILAGATKIQFISGMAALAAGAVLFLIAIRTPRPAAIMES